MTIVDEFVRHEAQRIGAAFMQIDVLKDRLKAMGVREDVIKTAEACTPVEAARYMQEMARLSPEGVRQLNRTAAYTK